MAKDHHSYKLLSWHKEKTHKHTHTEPIALPGPLKVIVMIDTSTDEGDQVAPCNNF